MNGGIARGGYASAANDDQPKKGGEKEMKNKFFAEKVPQMVLDEVAALKQRMTSENCHQLADEAITALEQARAAVTAHNTPETMTALEKAHVRANALTLALTPEMIVTRGIKFTREVHEALDRLDALPSWDDPLLAPAADDEAMDDAA
jgi:hypothetical protein